MPSSPTIPANAFPAHEDLVTETIERERSLPLAPATDSRLAVTRTLLATQTAVAAAVDRLALEPAGLDPATAEVLMHMARSECGFRGVDLGTECRLTATRVSRLLDRAEADGLVQRRPDPADRRAQQVVLTEKGRDAALRLRPLMDGVLDDLVLEALDDGEREQLVELLGRLRDRAHELLAQP
jgi:DNA-binding MarR family transcriptional regulator